MLDSLSDQSGAWGVDAATLLDALAEEIPAACVVLALVESRNPQPDAFLAVHGLDAADVLRWCREDHQHDPLWRQARRKGHAIESAASVPAQAAGLLPSGHAMVLALPADCQGQCFWMLALGRTGEPFLPQERHRADLLLRLLQCEFDHVAPPQMGRLLIGEDDRLMHADPRSEGCLCDAGKNWASVAAELQPIIRQCWPQLDDGETHDLAVTLGGTPVWLRFRRGRAMASFDRHHWYLELRPLSEDDVPPAQLFEDPRIGRAMGYLSDHYRQGPNLQEVAEAVDTSPFHFHRLFVRHTGISPKHYLLRMQLMTAKWLLRATRTPIGDVAAATGFASHGHFTATFHRFVGVSPSTYRELDGTPARSPGCTELESGNHRKKPDRGRGTRRNDRGS